MGVSLQIQRVDGRHGHLDTADISESLKLFNDIPWDDEIVQWEKISEEQREECRPLFQLFDDLGHSLHITAYSKDLIALAYNFPHPASPFGMDFEDEGYIGSDQFPRRELSALIECFFFSDAKAMRSLLRRFPTVTRE